MAVTSLLGAGDESKERAFLGAGDVSSAGARDFPEAVIARIAAAVAKGGRSIVSFSYVDFFYVSPSERPGRGFGGGADRELA